MSTEQQQNFTNNTCDEWRQALCKKKKHRTEISRFFPKQCCTVELCREPWHNKTENVERERARVRENKNAVREKCSIKKSFRYLLYNVVWPTNDNGTTCMNEWTKLLAGICRPAKATFLQLQSTTTPRQSFYCCLSVWCAALEYSPVAERFNRTDRHNHCFVWRDV